MVKKQHAKWSRRGTGKGSGASASSRKDPERSGGWKKPHRVKAGTRSLQEIRKLQKSVKEISDSFLTGVTSWQAEAIHALQEAAEDCILQLFENSMLCAIHAKRVTLMTRDIQLARRLKKIGQPY